MKITLAVPVMCVVFAWTGRVNADFVLSYTVEHGAPDAAHDRYNFYALNDGANGSGTRLLDEDIELVSAKPMVIAIQPDTGAADVTGTEAPNPYKSDRSFINILGGGGADVAGFTDDYNKPDRNVASNWSNGSTDFRVVGAHLTNYGVTANHNVNGGRGALIASMVVPQNDSFVELIPWGLAGEVGPIYGDFQGKPDPPPLLGSTGAVDALRPVVAVPEPTGAALIAAGILALAGRKLPRHFVVA